MSGVQSTQCKKPGLGLAFQHTQPVRVAAPLNDLLDVGDLFAYSRFWTIKQFDQRHRSVVANAESELQDTQVATRTGRETRAQDVEQLGNRITVAQTVERE